MDARTIRPENNDFLGAILFGHVTWIKTILLSIQSIIRTFH